MDVVLLGPFELRHNDVSVELGDLQQRFTLVALLLQANRPVSTDRLIDIVWTGQEAPKTNLITGYIARLRKSFRAAGAPESEISIDRTPTGYVLRIDTDRIDAVRFERLCEQATAAEREGDTDRRLTLLRAAVGLWRGRYLEALDLDRVGAVDVPSPEEKFYDALGDLAELELAGGNHRWVRDRLRPVVAREPTRQRLAGLLIRALVANGDRVQAMQIYHATRDALDEYGMDTSVELRKLARLAQRVEEYSMLPTAPRAFAGRARELRRISDRVHAAIESGRPAVLWLSGMPGVGKTGLALTAAHHLSPLFPDGQLFLQLNGFTPNVAPTTANDALAALLADLGVPPEQTPQHEERRLRLYHATLAGSRTMIVLDNAVSEEQVLPLLPAVPGCVTLVTSRRVGGTETTDGIHLDPLAREAAVELFRELAGTERVGPAASAEVADVVALCGCLPLSVRVVASQFRLHRAWSIEHLLRLLREGATWQPEGRFAAGNRLAYAVSYRQLSARQQTLFRLFGRVPGTDLSVPAAAALINGSPRQGQFLLEDLLEVSLLEETNVERYRMLDPLREFAGTLSATEPDTETTVAIDRLLDYYLVTVASAMTVAFPFDRDRQPSADRACAVAPVFADADAARSWLSAERSNLLAAIRFAASHDRPEHTWKLAVLLWRWHYARGQIQEWTETLELAARTIQGDTGDRRGLAYVLLRLAGARRQAGEPAQSLELAAQALTLWRGADDEQGQAAALCAIALGTLDRGDVSSAISHFEAALAKYQQIGDDRGQANALGNLGQLNELQGDLELAEHRGVTAATLLTDLGHTQGLAHTLDNLGLTRQRLGRLTEALADHERARQLAILVEDRACEAYALSNIANAHRRAGRHDVALIWHDKAREVADHIADPGLRIQLYLDRADTFLLCDVEAARLTYLAALDLAAGMGDRGQQVRASLGVAHALHADGRHEEARSYWNAAESAFVELGLPESAEIRRKRAGLDCPCAGEQVPAGNDR